MLKVNECKDGNWEIERGKLVKRRGVRTGTNEYCILLNAFPPQIVPGQGKENVAYIAKPWIIQEASFYLIWSVMRAINAVIIHVTTFVPHTFSVLMNYPPMSSVLNYLPQRL